MSGFRILPAGDAAFAVEFGETIDRACSDRVLALADRIERARIVGVIETVPTFRSLMVAFDPARVAFEALERSVAVLVDSAGEFAKSDGTAARPRRKWLTPACYHRELAPDLEACSARLGLTVDEFAARHAAIAHRVFMLGFLPGQPYLGELPEALALPRRETPRARVEAGSIGIAMRMTCIFPRATPCGLNVIARTPIPFWSPAQPDGALLSPGDEVTFQPISVERYHELSERLNNSQTLTADDKPFRAAS